MAGELGDEKSQGHIGSELTGVHHLVKAMVGQSEQVRRRISLTDRKKDGSKARLQSHWLKGNVVGFKDLRPAFQVE